MQKLKLQNKWNNDTRQFDKSSFELKESDKTISGKVSITSKQKDKFVSKSLPFILFKSQTNEQTQDAVKSGQPFMADFTLGVNEFDGEGGKKVSYIQMVIKEATLAEPAQLSDHHRAKADGFQPQEEDEESVPF